MHAFPTFASLALLLASRLALVYASIYVTNPVQSSTSTGGQPLTVTWVDNGESPTLASIGECEVGLYTGEFQLAQSLPSVDVSAASSFSFTPNPAAGPDGQYYLVFTASSVNYQGFSASFTLSGMSGTTPGGGSSTPATTTSADSSTSAGSSTPATSPAVTTTESSASATPSGTSSPVVGTTTPTSSPSAVVFTTTSGDTSITLTTTVSATSVKPTTTTSGTVTSASASPSATNAAVRIGSSTSFGGAAALLVLSGILAF